MSGAIQPPRSGRPSTPGRCRVLVAFRYRSCRRCHAPSASIRDVGYCRPGCVGTITSWFAASPSRNVVSSACRNRDAHEHGWSLSPRAARALSHPRSRVWVWFQATCSADFAIAAPPERYATDVGFNTTGRRQWRDISTIRCRATRCRSTAHRRSSGDDPRGRWMNPVLRALQNAFGAAPAKVLLTSAALVPTLPRKDRPCTARAPCSRGVFRLGHPVHRLRRLSRLRRLGGSSANPIRSSASSRVAGRGELTRVSANARGRAGSHSAIRRHAKWLGQPAERARLHAAQNAASRRIYRKSDDQQRVAAIAPCGAAGSSGSVDGRHAMSAEAALICLLPAPATPITKLSFSASYGVGSASRSVIVSPTFADVAARATLRPGRPCRRWRQHRRPSIADAWRDRDLRSRPRSGPLSPMPRNRSIVANAVSRAQMIGEHDLRCLLLDRIERVARGGGFSHIDVVARHDADAGAQVSCVARIVVDDQEIRQIRHVSIALAYASRPNPSPGVLSPGWQSPSSRVRFLDYGTNHLRNVLTRFGSARRFDQNSFRRRDRGPAPYSLPRQTSRHSHDAA